MRLPPCIPPQRVHFAGVNASPLVNMPLMAAHPSARLRAADRPPGGSSATPRAMCADAFARRRPT
jgi:hypothetical protein